MTEYCKKGIKLTRAFFKIDQEQSKDDPCCNEDECCEGMGDCGLECCNEDGNHPMGFCDCKSTAPERSDKEDKLWTKAYMASSKHREKCKQCTRAHEGK